eukprot:365430-Chlamydomonas_euryale.AAC.1
MHQWQPKRRGLAHQQGPPSKLADAPPRHPSNICPSQQPFFAQLHHAAPKRHQANACWKWLNALICQREAR